MPESSQSVPEKGEGTLLAESVPKEKKYFYTSRSTSNATTTCCIIKINCCRLSIFSISSRDNPFLPGGDLRKEADEILSQATIIRDTFILNEQRNAKHGGVRQETAPTSLHQIDNRSNGSRSNCVSQTPVTESMVETQVIKNESAVVQNASPTKTVPKENGQIEGDNSVSPASVSVGIPDDNKDKKKQKKCCSIM